jgi:telomerase reverse transcriptase
LRKYYPELVTLRQYLASRLSKKRRKKLQVYGRDPLAQGDADVSQLLDATVIGTFARLHLRDESVIEEDIAIFTQQLSGTTVQSSLRSLPQPEVGHAMFHRCVMW